MKKIIVLLTTMIVLSVSVCFVACSGGSDTDVTEGEASITSSDLDKAVSVHGINYRVSSSWEEDTNDGSVDGVIEIGFNDYTSKESSLIMGVFYSNSDLDQTAADAIAQDMDDDERSNVQYSEVDSFLFDGCNYTIYKYSYTASGYQRAGCIAYIMGSKMHYKIDVRSGNSSLSDLNVILSTVTII